MKKPPKPGADGAHPNRSTGPRSAAGKARSRMNALKTGIYANSLIIPGEDPAHLATLTEEYFQRYQPGLPEQRDQVDILVRSTWTLRRLAAAEAQVWIYEMERAYELSPNAPLGQAFHNCDRTLTRLQRTVNSTQRNYRDAVHELERLQALPLDPDPPPSSEVSRESHTPEPKPVLAPTQAPQPTPQPAENKSVSHATQFVPSASTPPPSAPQKASQKPLPFHIPGSGCPFDPIEPLEWKRCPVCFPHDCYADAQK
ncbi:MAG: hypothetical protein LAQ69_15445 [Acidobacteriia bacterium]|nr:hypothetical protein [Terriglobia bacterium]